MVTQIDFNKFSDEFIACLKLAEEEAWRIGSETISSYLLLIGILKLGRGDAFQAISDQGCTLATGRQLVRELRGNDEKLNEGSIPEDFHRQLRATRSVKRLLELSYELSEQRGEPMVSLENLLESIINSENAQLLRAFKIDSKRLQKDLARPRLN